jgi:hypothetical protein
MVISLSVSNKSSLYSRTFYFPLMRATGFAHLILLHLISLILLHQSRLTDILVFTVPIAGVLTLICVWAEFRDVDTNVPLLRLLQEICGGEDFPKTSAKRRGGTGSCDRTLLSQVCLEGETGNRDTLRTAISPTDWPSQHWTPEVLSTAKVGERFYVNFRPKSTTLTLLPP